MTPAERRALAFFAAVGALGLGARAAGLGAPPPVDLPGDGAAAERQALAGQLAAVDSARAARSAGKRAGKARTTSKPTAAGGRRRRAVPADTATGAWPLGSWARPLTPTRPPADTRLRGGPATSRPATAPEGPLDADVADSAAFERLPGVGPALARRLVADRRAHGPFGSVAGLSRVPGIGPALETRLAPLVTFSGRPAGP